MVLLIRGERETERERERVRAIRVQRENVQNELVKD
jgi:hypothetical protein